MAKKRSKARKRVARPAADADLGRLLRVDHAGEFGAQQIYAGQIAVLGKRKIGGVLRHMAAQEQEHLRAFEDLLNEHKVRPSALHPLWRAAGYALGVGTAMLGEKAAMACTVAVEEVIDDHYRRQLESLGKRRPELSALIARFRQEEIEHRDLALQHDAESLPYYRLLRAAVRTGSKTAIWLAARI